MFWGKVTRSESQVYKATHPEQQISQLYFGTAVTLLVEKLDSDVKQN